MRPKLKRVVQGAGSSERATAEYNLQGLALIIYFWRQEHPLKVSVASQSNSTSWQANIEHMSPRGTFQIQTITWTLELATIIRVPWEVNHGVCVCGLLLRVYVFVYFKVRVIIFLFFLFVPLKMIPRPLCVVGKGSFIESPPQPNSGFSAFPLSNEGRPFIHRLSRCHFLDLSTTTRLLSLPTSFWPLMTPAFILASLSSPSTQHALAALA